MKKTLGTAGLFLTAMIWGGGFIACDIALKDLSPFAVMSLRFLIAAICMGTVANKKLKNISKNETLYGILLGLALFGSFAFQTIGLQTTSPSKNAFLTATNVVIVPIIAYFIGKKKIELKTVFGAILALAGVGLLSINHDFSIGFGDFVTLLGAIGFAFQIYLTGLFSSKISIPVLNFLQMSTACLLSFAGLFVGGNLSFNAGKESLLAVIYLGIASTTICYFLQVYGQKYVEETKSAIILSMESVFGTIFSVIILSEAVTGRMLLGGGMIFAAVLISELKLAKKKSLKVSKQDRLAA